MHKTRLEAFSDGVVAILITIMVLEFHLPDGAGWEALRPVWPTFCAYVLSFVYLGIYWNNHHHLFHLVDTVSGGIMWANLHLLFWLSLVPFVTNWMGDHPHDPFPTAVYGIVLLCAAVAFTILVRTIVRAQGPHSKLKEAIRGDFKGNISMLLYVLGIASTLVRHEVAWAFYVLVAMIWLVPDKRIERVL